MNKKRESLDARSLNEKLRLPINGTSLGVFLTAKRIDLPVLLFLGGGPGIPEYLLECMFHSEIDEEFLVCYLEYRGTATSYDATIAKDTMTMQQYMQDVLGVTDYLKNRFHKEKIYLMGHSFGTSIAIQMGKHYPNRYHAYIAMSQICDQRRSEIQAYDYMRNEYEHRGKKGKVKKFMKYPIKDSLEAYNRYYKSWLRDSSMHALGVGTVREMHSVITGILFPSFRCKAYTVFERIHIWKGKGFAQSSKICQEAFEFNAFMEVPSLTISVYFFAGKYDYTCLMSIQQEYYEYIKAPVKTFYLFEESAHSPLFEEPTKARQRLREIKNNVEKL